MKETRQVNRDTDRELIVRKGKLYWQYVNGDLEEYECSELDQNKD